MEFKVGDPISWVYVSKRGRMISMSKVQGIIHEIKDNKARCRRGKKGKKDYWIELERLGRPQDNSLMKFAEAMAGRTSKEEADA